MATHDDPHGPRRPTLWAISDLHTGHTGNKPITESLHPASPDDWLEDVPEATHRYLVDTRPGLLTDVPLGWLDWSA